MNNEIYLSGINYESFVDGNGVRAAFYISGCNHKCKGCHNEETWDFKHGQLITDSLINEINTEIKKRPYLSGITITGGDPMYSSSGVVELLKKLYIPKNNIWLYTGFELHELCNFAKDNPDIYELLGMINVLVDGPYIEGMRTTTQPFIGSSNQIIHNLKI